MFHTFLLIIGGHFSFSFKLSTSDKGPGLIAEAFEYFMLNVFTWFWNNLVIRHALYSVITATL